jgi:hypothetical protein
MREADENRRKREVPRRLAAKPDGPKSAWDVDDDDDDSDANKRPECEDASGDEQRFRDGVLGESNMIPPPAQRALEFIAGRHGPPRQPSLSEAGRPSPNCDHESSSTALHSGYSLRRRPQTGHSRSLGITQKTNSQPHLAPTSQSHGPPVLDVRPSPTHKTPMEGGPTSTPSSNLNAEKRLSTSSTKRLSFTEFTKRLSSTSSLLMVQTNASAGSSRGSSETELHQQQQQQQQQQQLSARGFLHPRGAPPPPANERDREAWEKRCGWRGSVGVFGTEGGFL